MTHDKKCEAPGYQRETGIPRCSCADRAIAKARREGRIQGYMFAVNCEDYPDCKDCRDEAEALLDAEWPEDKP